MKKSRKSPEPLGEGEARRPSGPPKEKVQLTVRLNKVLLEETYALLQKTNQRITDVLERGLVLALKESDDLPVFTTEVRFLVANTTRQQQEQLLDFLILLVIDELRRPSPAEALAQKYFREYLKLLRGWRNQALHLYSRFGRTAEEIQKLTGSP